MTPVYTLLHMEDDKLRGVYCFSTPRNAYRFINEHILKLDADSLSKGYGEPCGTTLFYYRGLNIELKLTKVELLK